MTVYLLHLSRRIGGRAGHYLGATALPFGERMRRHETARGAALLREARRLGVQIRVARVWKCANKDEAFRLEIALKRRKRSEKYCLFCKGDKAII